MTDIEKEEKYKLILDKVYEVFKKSDFNTIKMVDVAKQCGVAKGTIFNYFNTKEELFIELLIREYGKWFSELNEAIIGHGEMPINKFTDIITSYIYESIEDYDVFFRLNAILHTVLETNISYEEAVRFKMFLYENVEHTGQLISNHVEQFPKEKSVHLMIALHSLAVGYMNMTSMSSTIKQAIKNNRLEAFNIDFRTDLLKTFRIFLIGLIKE
jgi:AcrR family transcriptional regulator